jgi:hypothetical protein
MKAGDSCQFPQYAAPGGFMLLTGNTVYFTGSAAASRTDLPSLRKPESFSMTEKIISVLYLLSPH